MSNPNHSELKLQGKDRILIKVHDNTEQVTKSGLIAKLDKFDLPKTGTVLAKTALFDEDKYPDVKIGARVFCNQLSWDEWTSGEDRVAIVDCSYVRAVY